MPQTHAMCHTHSNKDRPVTGSQYKFLGLNGLQELQLFIKFKMMLVNFSPQTSVR